MSGWVRPGAAGALDAIAHSLSFAHKQPDSPCNTAVSLSSNMAYVPSWAHIAWLALPGFCGVAWNLHPLRD